MKFRRKSAAPAEAEGAEQTGTAEAPEEAGVGPGGAPATPEEEGTPAAGSVAARGPRDADDVDLGDESVPRIDLGALLLTPAPGMQLRMQVDENTQRVQAVIVTGPDGALEVMAFAAPRSGGLWDEVRPQIAADMARRGGTATEQQGPWGTELHCRLTVQRADGTPAQQPSRIIGVDGPRWLLRATLLGRPAVDAQAAQAWEQVLADVVVRRGGDPKPVGDQLPIVLPPEARPVS